MLTTLQATFGIVVFLSVCWVLSEQRERVTWQLIAAGLGLQFSVAFLLFNVPALQSALAALNSGVNALATATEAGTAFVFGYLGAGPGDTPYPYTVADPASTYVMAFRVLPLILFFTVLSALLWHLRILPWVIRVFALVLERTLRVGGAVGVGTAANIFLGMVEAPLLIRPYIRRLARAELFMLMTCGMATVAGSVMVLYSIFLTGYIENPLGHILTASVISAPAALMIAAILIPGEHSTEAILGSDAVSYDGVMDAITSATADGIRLMVNVGAMLIVLVALVALADGVMGLLPDVAGAPLALDRVMGWLFAPIAWLMGVPWSECFDAGAIMGTKIVLNELLAFLKLIELTQLSAETRLILTYAVCGFANFGSLGIMIGGLAAMCPERRGEIVRLAPKSLFSGTVATCLTGAVAGLLG